MDLVAIGVVRRDEAVGLSDVVAQTGPPDAALQAIEPARSDALDVADLLRHSPDVTGHPRIDLRDVRLSVGVAPRSVEEDGDVHPPRPARIWMASPPFPRETRCRGRSTAWTRVSAIRHSGITATQAADVRCGAIQQVAFRSPLRCSGDCSPLRRPAIAVARRPHGPVGQLPVNIMKTNNDVNTARVTTPSATPIAG